MDEQYTMQLMREGLYLVLIVSAPAIAASLIVGLIVSMLQATTQLQDHTLTFVPKLVAVLAALAISGPWIGAQLLKFTKAVYIAFPSIR